MVGSVDVEVGSGTGAGIEVGVREVSVGVRRGAGEALKVTRVATVFAMSLSNPRRLFLFAFLAGVMGAAGCVVVVTVEFEAAANGAGIRVGLEADPVALGVVEPGRGRSVPAA